MKLILYIICFIYYDFVYVYAHFNKVNLNMQKYVLKNIFRKWLETMTLNLFGTYMAPVQFQMNLWVMGLQGSDQSFFRSICFQIKIFLIVFYNIDNRYFLDLFLSGFEIYKKISGLENWLEKKLLGGNPLWVILKEEVPHISQADFFHPNYLFWKFFIRLMIFAL